VLLLKAPQWSEQPGNEARGNVGIALSNLMHGPPTPEKIEKAKGAVEEWLKRLASTGRVTRRVVKLFFGRRRWATRVIEKAGFPAGSREAKLLILRDGSCRRVQCRISPRLTSAVGHSRHSRYPGVSGLPRERSVFWAARPPGKVALLRRCNCRYNTASGPTGGRAAVVIRPGVAGCLGRRLSAWATVFRAAGEVPGRRAYPPVLRPPAAALYWLRATTPALGLFTRGVTPAGWRRGGQCSKCPYLLVWRGGRVAEGGGLLNRYTV